MQSLDDIHRNLNDLVTDVIREALSKAIEAARTAHATSQNTINNKMNCVNMREFNALDEEAVTPVLPE